MNDSLDEVVFYTYSEYFWSIKNKHSKNVTVTQSRLIERILETLHQPKYVKKKTHTKKTPTNNHTIIVSNV